MTQAEFDALMADATKRIVGDIVWLPDPQHTPALNFRKEVVSATGPGLYMKGWYNPASCKLAYTLIHRQAGRIYALNLGREHRNPTGEQVGEKHKHSWTQESRDKLAYAPSDITESWNRPIEVWRQFCREARIAHEGTMNTPVPETEVNL